MFANNNGLAFYLKGYGLFIVCFYVLHLSIGNEAFNQVFQVINSVGLIVFGIYFFKKKAMPGIVESIEEHQLSMQQLHNQADTLNSKKHLLDKELTSQLVLMGHLDEKIQNWRDSSMRKNEELEQEKNFVRERLSEKRKVQSYCATIEKARQDIVLHALSQARESLNERFSSSECGDQFLEDILEYMKKEAQ